MKRIWSICFVDDEVLHPVQLADMFVYLLREEGERQIYSSDQPKNPLLERIGGRGKTQIHPVNAERFYRPRGRRPGEMTRFCGFAALMMRLSPTAKRSIVPSGLSAGTRPR